MKKLNALLMAGLLIICSTVVFSAPALEAGACVFANEDFTLIENDDLVLRWQNGGDLVLSQKMGEAFAELWGSNTQGKAGRICRLANGNLVMFRNAVDFVADEPVALNRGECISAQKTLADNGTAVLVWQADGNLVLYDAKLFKKKRYAAIWASKTGTGRRKGLTRRLCFEEDGNLSVQDEAGEHLWQTETAGVGDALQLGYDCNLQLIDAEKIPVWTSHMRALKHRAEYCGVTFKPLWRAFTEDFVTSMAELRMDACTASLVAQTGVLWRTETPWCVPTISDTFTLPDNTAFIPAAYFERNKKVFAAAGAESSGGARWPGQHDHAVPYIRLFEGVRFSRAYYELINISLADLKEAGRLDDQISSFEFRGTWQLCAEPHYEGRCIEVDARHHTRVEDIAAAYGDDWAGTISSVRLLGYTHPLTGVFIRAHFADTRKLCVETGLTDDARRSQLKKLRLYLKGSAGDYLINTGGQPSWCMVSLSGEAGRYCCDTGYNGFEEPALAGWDRLEAETAVDRVMIKRLDVTGRAKLQGGLVGEAAMINAVTFNPPRAFSKHQFCLSRESVECNAPD